MATLINNSFQIAATGIYNGNKSGLNLFSVHPGYAKYRVGGVNVENANLPLRFSHYFSRDNVLVFDMPIRYSKYNSAKSYQAAIGLAWSHVMLRRKKLVWALTPGGHVGVVGSADLASGTLMYDVDLGSRLSLPRGKWIYGMTNDVDYVKTPY